MVKLISLTNNWDLRCLNNILIEIKPKISQDFFSIHNLYGNIF